MIRFEFENVGALAKAEICLGELTIICGKNNTGKTYVTNSVFGFLHMWRNFMVVGGNANGKVKLDLSELLRRGSQTIKVDEYLQHQQEILKHASQIFESKYPETFGSTSENFSGARFNCSLDQVSKTDLIQSKSRLGSPEREFLSIHCDAKKRQIDISLLGSQQAMTSMPHEVLVELVGDLVRQISFGTAIPRPLISSSERTGIATFRKHLNFAMSNLMDKIRSGLENIDPKEFLDEIKSGYPISIDRNVDFSRKLEDVSKHDSFLKHFDKDVLDRFNSMLGGTYQITNDDRLYFRPKRSTKRLTMRESSSAIRSLLDVHFYLNHVIQPGDILIIDEPEQSLHPSNQREFARLLARLVNNGVKAFITTHSDYILRELNTLIMMNNRGNRTASIRDQYGYSERDTLDAGKLKVYEARPELIELPKFSKRVRRQTLVELPLSQEFGIEADVFDVEIDEMNEIQDRLIWGDD